MLLCEAGFGSGVNDTLLDSCLRIIELDHLQEAYKAIDIPYGISSVQKKPTITWSSDFAILTFQA